MAQAQAQKRVGGRGGACAHVAGGGGVGRSKSREAAPWFARSLARRFSLLTAAGDSELSLRDVFSRSLGHGGAVQAAGRDDSVPSLDSKGGAVPALSAAVPIADRSSAGLGDRRAVPDPRK